MFCSSVVFAAIKAKNCQGFVNIVEWELILFQPGIQIHKMGTQMLVIVLKTKHLIRLNHLAFCGKIKYTFV